MHSFFIVLIVFYFLWNALMKAMKERTTYVSDEPNRTQSPIKQSPLPQREVPRRSRPPVDWNLVRENLNPEEIKQCFDIKGLQRGYTLETLPQYVNVDKLRQLIPLPILVDMLDLDFFEKAKGSIVSQAQVPAAAEPSAEQPAETTTKSILASKPAEKIKASQTVSSKKLFVKNGLIFLQLMQPSPGMQRYRYGKVK